MKVKCPHCQAETDVMLPHQKEQLLVRCGNCKRYFAIDCDGGVEKK